MRRYSFLILFLASVTSTVFAQTPSPEEFLGYPLGSKFTPHQKVVDYFKIESVENHIKQII